VVFDGFSNSVRDGKELALSFLSPHPLSPPCENVYNNMAIRKPERLSTLELGFTLEFPASTTVRSRYCLSHAGYSIFTETQMKTNTFHHTKPLKRIKTETEICKAGFLHSSTTAIEGLADYML
jgi:hypothetical protein